MALAESNGIAPNTVYARLQRGWDLERAISEPPKKLRQLEKLSRNEEGSLVTAKPKGRIRSLRLDRDLDEKVDEAIASSGLTMADWFSDFVREHLNSKSSRKERKAS